MFESFGSSEHKIYLGDACEVLSGELADDSVDLIFADPPYNIGKNFNGRKDRWPSDKDYLSWCYEWLAVCVRKLRATGSLYVMAATQFMPFFDIFLRNQLTIASRLVWYYDSSGVQARRCFGSMYEPILLCVKDRDNYTFNADAIRVEAKTGAHRKLIDYRKPVPSVYSTTKVPGNVWQFPRVRYRMDEYENHPSQKPVALLDRIIRASSNPGEIVLDPFSGTFTTSAVAKQLGRKSIGIEIEEQYVKIGLQRLALASSYKGIPLHRPAKTHQRKNFGGIRNAAVGEKNHRLFE